MEYIQLERLNTQLKEQFSDYISMIAVGSTAVGDPFIPGRSDRDMLLMFKNNPIQHLSRIEKILTSMNFDESYAFTPLRRDDFGRSDSKYTFSNRFRSKTLFGRDLVQFSFLPESEVIRSMYMSGLKETMNKMNNCLINSGNWSEAKVRDIMWKQFKHTFMYLAIKEYYETRKYPVTRKDLVERLKSPEINKTFDVLHSIDAQPKDKIIDCSRELTKYIQNKIY